MVEYEVRQKKSVTKRLTKGKVPKRVQELYYALVRDLRSKGPVLPNWPNYSKLGEDRYHCHLNRRWVAVWTHEKGTIVVEVTYVGSREKAPY